MGSIPGGEHCAWHAEGDWGSRLSQPGNAWRFWRQAEGLTVNGAEPVLSPPESVDRNMVVRKHGWWAQRDLD